MLVIYTHDIYFGKDHDMYINGLPYSGKFLEGKIFGNLPFTNTSEINFRKPCAISNL